GSSHAVRRTNREIARHLLRSPSELAPSTQKEGNGVKGVLVGLVAGCLVGIGVAHATSNDIVVPPKARVVVKTPGSKYSTTIKFPGLDLSCSYGRLLNAVPTFSARKGDPVLFCSR